MELFYKKRIVAFIDILGFKNMVLESEEDQTKLKSISEALSFLKTWEVPFKWGLELIEIEESAQKKGLQNFTVLNQIRCTCFSDSIVVSATVESDNINEVFSTIVTNIAFIGAKLISDGILVRGGITIGNLIHEKDGTVIGRALIDAYEIESTSAVYPRIIISDKLVEQLIYPILKKRDSYPYHQYLSRFEDGCVGFTQLIYYQVLQSWEKMNSQNLKMELKKTKQVIVNGLNKSFVKPMNYKKYLWLKNQYNDLIILDKNLKEEIRSISENNIHFC
jgi:hypothetical protein